MTEIVREHEPGITLLRFNRPRCLNAFSMTMYRRLGSELERFNQDPAQRVLVMTGAGRAFSSGQDLDDAGALDVRDSEQVAANIDTLQSITRVMMDTYKPVIAAINGPAVGFGAELTLACDFRMAARSAYFMLPELRRGLFFTNATVALLPRLIGADQAARLMLTGERMSADEALAAGLVTQVCEDGQVLEAALALARQLAELAAPSVRLTIEALRKGAREQIQAAMAYESAANVHIAAMGRDQERAS